MEQNLDRAEALVREAARGMPDLDLILLPECVDFLARSPEEALTLAAAASALAVSRPGAADAVPGYTEVLAAL